MRELARRWGLATEKIGDASPRGWAIAVAILALATTSVRAQIVTELEPERPISMEDAHPLSYRAISGSADWSYNWRQGRNDYGPGFSLSYGAARDLEVGAAVRYVTSPGNNASRGISSEISFSTRSMGSRRRRPPGRPSPCASGFNSRPGS